MAFSYITYKIMKWNDSGEKAMVDAYGRDGNQAGMQPRDRRESHGGRRHEEWKPHDGPPTQQWRHARKQQGSNLVSPPHKAEAVDTVLSGDLGRAPRHEALVSLALAGRFRFALTREMQQRERH